VVPISDGIDQAAICEFIRRNSPALVLFFSILTAGIVKVSARFGKDWTLSFAARLIIIVGLGLYIRYGFLFLENLDEGKGPFADPKSPLIISVLFIECMFFGGLTLVFILGSIFRDRNKNASEGRV